MISHLKPYTEYKDSALPWLGQVPAAWSISRIKTVLREVECRSWDGHGTLFSLTRVRGLIPHADRTDKIHSAKTLIGYKRYQRGQIVMNRMQAWSGMFGMGATDGLVSPDYAVFTIIGGHQTKFLLERLKTPDLVEQFAVESKGIGSGFNRLYTDRFGSIALALPPRAEQAAIVQFLDWASGRLERAIRAKRKVIALLGEQKQGIIHGAVTRGLDPSVPLKPSGIPWLGDIPRHWNCVPIKRILSRIDYGTSEAITETGSIRVLTMGNIQKGEVVMPRSGGLDDLPEALLLRRHDLLFTRTNGNPELVGKVGIFRGEVSERVSFASYLVRLRVRGEYEAEWLHLLLNSSAFWSFARSHALVNLQTNLNSTRYSQFLVPVPPRAEQEKLVRWIADESAVPSTAISRLEREIELLGEYRTRLVADVVTGKLDVREAALHLAEEAPPDATGDDADLIADVDASDDEASVG